MYLVIIEAGPDGLASTSVEALTTARQLAGNDEVSAVLVPTGQSPENDVDGTLSAFGVARRFRLHHSALEDYSPELWGAALAALIEDVEPRIVLSGGGQDVMEVMAQAGARARLPYAANCMTIEANKTDWQVTRARQGGLVHDESSLSASTVMVSLTSGAVEATAAGPAAGDVAVEDFEPALDGIRHSRLVERTARSGGVSLSTARVVVSGGRGIGSAEGFAPLEELAGLVGGAVGCSRVATNEGWRPHSDQVGQTGTKVNPELYIACGISGAVQHWVGCMGSKNILAINTDPEASLVTRADYAVIGDAGDVIAAVNTEILNRHATSDVTGATAIAS